MKKLILFLCAAVLSALASRPAYALETPHLNAAYAGGDRVKLWWSEIPMASYQVLYGPAGSPMAHGAVLGDGESYTVGGLFRNTWYVFAIKAVKGDKVSMLSNSVKVWVGESGRMADKLPVAPAMPASGAQNVKAGVGYLNVRAVRGVSPGTVVLNWDEPAGVDVGSYNVVYTDDPAMEKWGVLGVSRDLRVYVVSGLAPGKKYWFWMSTQYGGRTPWVSNVAR